MELETRPMSADEMSWGQYVCVEPMAYHTYGEHGGKCKRSPHITITEDGVWVRQQAAEPKGVFTSAHRSCLEAWAAEAEEGK